MALLWNISNIKSSPDNLTFFKKIMAGFILHCTLLCALWKRIVCTEKKSKALCKEFFITHLFIGLIWSLKIEKVRNYLLEQVNGPSYPVFDFQKWQQQMLFTESMQVYKTLFVCPLCTFLASHSVCLGFCWFFLNEAWGTLPAYFHQFRNLLHVKIYPFFFFFQLDNTPNFPVLPSHEVPETHHWVRTVPSHLHAELTC